MKTLLFILLALPGFGQAYTKSDTLPATHFPRRPISPNAQKIRYYLGTPSEGKGKVGSGVAMMFEFHSDGLFCVYVNVDLNQHTALLERIKKVEGVSSIDQLDRYSVWVFPGKLFSQYYVRDRIQKEILDYFKQQ